MIAINRYTTIGTLNDIVKEMGEDYIYTDLGGNVAPRATCVYVFEQMDEENPGQTKLIQGCIVGRFFAKLGIELRDLCGGGGSESLIGDLIDKGLISIDEKSRTILKLVQMMQDQGIPYGRAVQLAASMSHHVKLHNAE